ncbi:hypothetical protein N0V90_009267 [Kalmusia sp. IMI 367209]|nr:hypothetical protein N0V90_009267 [Kalmusia sp. IMI 367209]
MTSLTSTRLDPLELQAPEYILTDAQTEELPGYEPAPEYNRELYEAPLYTYHLRQLDKKCLMIVPYGPSTSDSYKITSRGSRLFSKKPEMDVHRTIRAQADDEYVAGIWFDVDGPLPWCPRARFVRYDFAQDGQTYRMESRNFSDWSISVDGIIYTWILEAKPFTLTLRADGSQDTIARFHFSIYGLSATRGAESGDLTIYRNRLSADRAGVENILCSLVTASEQFKKMGRLYKNEPGAMPERAPSSPEERVPLHRTAIAPFWSSGEC